MVLAVELARLNIGWRAGYYRAVSQRQRQRQRFERAAKLYLSSHLALRHKNVRFDAILIAPHQLLRHLQDAWRLCTKNNVL